MRIDVAFLPSEAQGWQNAVCIVIDALRATSSIVTMLERGCTAVIPLPSVAAARRLADAHGYLLAGERQALRPRGFDFGNSPVAFHDADLAGRTVAFTTTNGTAALKWLAGAPIVLAGSLLNATACCRAALGLAAGRGAAVGIVCAGRLRRFTLDDALCAGYMVSIALRMLGQDSRGETSHPGAVAELNDAARASLRIARDADLLVDLRSSGSGRRLVEAGLEPDIAYCARPDASDVVPVLVRGTPDRFERLKGDGTWTG